MAIVALFLFKCPRPRYVILKSKEADADALWGCWVGVYSNDFDPQPTSKSEQRFFRFSVKSVIYTFVKDMHVEIFTSVSLQISFVCGCRFLLQTFPFTALYRFEILNFNLVNIDEISVSNKHLNILLLPFMSRMQYRLWHKIVTYSKWCCFVLSSTLCKAITVYNHKHFTTKQRAVRNDYGFC